MNRLRLAYAALWDRYPATVWVALLAVFIASLIAFVLAALMLSPWAALALLALVTAGLLLSFAPGDGALILRGAVAADGGLAGELNTQPPGKPPFLLTVHGHLDEARATLTYATPRCTTTATLGAT